MTLTPEILLSEQFVSFSSKIAALHEKKKELVAEFKKVYEEHKSQVKTIDDEAESLQNAFNEWANSKKKD